MIHFRKAVALLLSLCLLASVSFALAESTSTEAAQTPIPSGTDGAAVYPETGTILYESGDARVCPLTVVNNTDYALVIKLSAYQWKMSIYFSASETEVVAITFFIRPNDTAVIDVPEGAYQFTYIAGTEWLGTDELFGDNAVSNTESDMWNFQSGQNVQVDMSTNANGDLVLDMTGASRTVADTATAEVTQAVTETAPALNDTDVVARVNGNDVTWAEVLDYYQGLVNYYGDPDDTTLELYYAVAMEEAVTMRLIQITAAANGLDQYTQEELDSIYATSDENWQSALDNYVQNSGSLTDESTDEDKALLYAEAEAYYANLGYDKDKLRQNYLDNETYTRVENFVCKDITVTDEEIQAQYQANVENDKQLYENDLDAYEYQMMLYNYQYATEKPWYHPAGYRYVKHILLPVDDTLLTAYTDLQAQLEEQMEEESAVTTDGTDATTTDAAATTEPAETPVTEADVDSAKADILASVQDTTTEIYDKIAQGEDFDALIAEYAVNADGTATDEGMVNGSYPNGYEVSLASTSYVPEFVEAAFSIDEVGGVSAPYVSDYGVHIVKYVGDVPSGGVDLTDELKESLRTSMLSTKTEDAMNAWQATADIQYTGLLKSYDELQSEDAGE